MTRMLCGALKGMWHCTRPIGHLGDHIATIGPYVDGEPPLDQWAMTVNEIGPTGHGAGTTGPSDRGGIRTLLSLDRVHRRLHLDFGVSLTFISMTAEQARVFARELIEKADELDARKT